MMPSPTAHVYPTTSLKAADAIDRAREWVEREATSTPGFCGAHLKGSLLTTPPEDPWPADHDVDVNIVVRGARERNRFTDVLYRGILIDCAWTNESFYHSAEDLLSNIALAPNLALPGVILVDPTGRLEPLAEQVARQYSEERWVRARCLRCRELAAACRAELDSGSILDASKALWKLIERLCAQLAVVHLRSPTHRRGLIVTGEVLRNMGRPEVHEAILALAGYATATAEQARRLVDECEVLFDRARALLDAGGALAPGERFRPHARDYVLAGSREMIDAGHPREAMHWIVAQVSLALGALLRLETADERPKLQKRLLEIVAAQGLATDEDRELRTQMAAVVCRDVDGLVDDLLQTTFG